MRVVFDSNVIIAAFATRGICAEIFEVCLEGHVLVTSEHILDEVRKALVKKIRLPATTALEIVSYVKEVAEIAETVNINVPGLRDPVDALVLSTAINGNARLVITGDADLLTLKKFRGVEIITPRKFWEKLSAK